MKKTITWLFLLMISISFVSAAPPFEPRSAVTGAAEIVVDLLEPVVGILLGGEGNLLFERLLFFLIILSVVYVVISKIPKFEDNTAIIWVVTLAVALLSTRFLTDTDLVQTILLPYSVLGVALTAALPLIIYFFFVVSFDTPTVRKILWVFFVVIFWGLWSARYDDLGGLSWIYFMTGLIALIFLFADGTIRRILIKQQMEQLGIRRIDDFERKVRRQINDADDDLTKKIITPSQHASIKRRLQKQLKSLRKN